MAKIKNSSLKKRKKARILVLHCLYKLEFINESPDIIFEETSENFRINKELLDFANHLFKTILNNNNKLEKIIGENLKNWDLKRLAIIDKAILKIGIAEILYMPDIPKPVSINEAVNIAKTYSLEKAPKLINAVLDHIAKKSISKENV